MKQTKDVGLVSCGLEEYLISKLNKEINNKNSKGDKHASRRNAD